MRFTKVSLQALVYICIHFYFIKEAYTSIFGQLR